MASVITMPSGTLKYAYRQHRLVVLPDYQGLGIGTKVNDFFAQYFVSRGYKYFIRTTHVRMSNHMRESPLWVETSTNGKVRSVADIKRSVDKQEKKLAHTGIIGDTRVASSFEYMGEEYANKPQTSIKCDSTCDICLFKRYIERLRQNYFVKVVTGVPSEDNEIEKAMRELGVRTEQLYIRKGDTLSENGKHKNVPLYEEPKLVAKIENKLFYQSDDDRFVIEKDGDSIIFEKHFSTKEEANNYYKATKYGA